jgi:hypothetical protein
MVRFGARAIVTVDLKPLDLRALRVVCERAVVEETKAAEVLAERRIARIHAEDALRAAERGLPTTPQKSEAAWRAWWAAWEAGGPK